MKCFVFNVLFMVDLQFCTITIGICMYKKYVLKEEQRCYLVSDAFPQR